MPFESKDINAILISVLAVGAIISYFAPVLASFMNSFNLNFFTRVFLVGIAGGLAVFGFAQIKKERHTASIYIAAGIGTILVVWLLPVFVHGIACVLCA